MKPLLLVISVIFLSIHSVSSAPWPFWRGDIAGSGRTSETDLPLEWGKEKNVKWRIELPERGNSTPIIGDGKVFITQAIDADKFRGVMCFDRENGKLLWKKGLSYEKEERTHGSNPYASASPATDGKTVVAYLGSAGAMAWDLDGNEKWRVEFGPIDHVWGNSTSPIILGDLVYLYHGPGPGAFLTALNLQTGKEVWKFDEPKWDVKGRTDGFRNQDGDGVVGSFSSPILIDAGERKELVMSFPQEMKSFDPETGDVLWTAKGLNPLVYTSPVQSEENVIVLGGYHGNSISVKTGGKGDVTESNRLWQKVRHNGGIGTGVTKDGMYYYQDAGGIVSCLDVKTGEEKWKARLPGAGKSWGSFILSGDLVYTLSQAGDTVVFKTNPEEFEVVAQSDIGEQTNSSLAISDGDIFIRTWEALWCISKD